MKKRQSAIEEAYAAQVRPATSISRRNRMNESLVRPTFRLTPASQ